jgi:hypothetical protein
MIDVRRIIEMGVFIEAGGIIIAIYDRTKKTMCRVHLQLRSETDRLSVELRHKSSRECCACKPHTSRPSIFWNVRQHRLLVGY